MAPLPKKFSLKLLSVIQATPSEFADMLVEEKMRPQWEYKLKQVKKKTASSLELEYVGLTNAHVVNYDFEQFPERAGLPASFLIHEHTEKNKGIATQTVIYLLEEVMNRPGFLRVSCFCEVSSENEARSRIKNMLSLTAAMQCLDRKKLPAGSL